MAGFIIIVLINISVGGITRLTRSGLSISDWRPLTGAIPPLTEDAWEIEFKKYKQTPEFKIVNYHFKISDYKKIYLWEYTHRLLGRILFLYTLILGLLIWKLGEIPISIPIRLSALVALQGLIGWIMVRSGLNQLPMVSPFKLALHYFFALGLLVYAFYILTADTKIIYGKNSVFFKSFIKLTGAMITLQIFYGCLMSGFKAGYLSNTFPLMQEHYIPFPKTFQFMSQLNVFTNPFFIHWVHRWIGILLFIAVAMLTFFARKILPSGNRAPFYYLLFVISLQCLIGILNIIFHIPITLAIIHQILAALVALAYLNILFSFKSS